jgi:hypothetical protein
LHDYNLKEIDDERDSFHITITKHFSSAKKELSAKYTNLASYHHLSEENDALKQQAPCTDVPKQVIIKAKQNKTLVEVILKDLHKTCSNISLKILDTMYREG